MDAPTLDRLLLHGFLEDLMCFKLPFGNTGCLNM